MKDKKRDLKKEEEKYNRRDALSKIGYGARATAAAATYGVVGNVLGLGYKGARNTANVIENTIKSPADWISKKYNHIRGREESKKSKRKNVSRRNFLLYMMGKNPQTTGTIIGATYGAVRSGIKNHDRYQQRLERAKAELAREEDKEDRKKLYKEIKGLRQQISNLENKEGGGLEKKIEGKTLIFFGVVTLLISASFSTFSITGNLISMSNNQAFSLSIIFFVLSLIIIFMGIKKFRN